MVAIGAAIILVTFRLLIPAGGDPSKFVVAGTVFADPAETPANLYVFDSNGYDGQFVWRIAADPTHLKTDRDLGVAIDEPYRLQRVGYPFLAWLLSFGNTSLLAWSLIAVNVLAVGVLAGCGALFAADHGRSPWFGLAVASVPAFAFTLSRDLTELVAAAVLAAGVLAATKGRWWLAAALWSYAVLTREQLLIPIAAFAMWRLWTIVRRRSRPDVQDAAWILPAVVFVAWQMVIWRVDGEIPLFSGSSNLGPPFVGLVGSMGFWGSELGNGAKALVTNLLTFYELGFLVVLVLVATSKRGPDRVGLAQVDDHLDGGLRRAPHEVVTGRCVRLPNVGGAQRARLDRGHLLGPKGDAGALGVGSARGIRRRDGYTSAVDLTPSEQDLADVVPACVSG